MIDKPKDDTSAFPILNIHFDSEKGMTLRDWFAGQAMNGLICRGLGAMSDINNRKSVVANAYAVADAMLRERAR